jgi:hypothetical protein
MMIFTREQLDELDKAAEPLIKFLNDNCHPHTAAIVNPDSVEIVEAVCYLTNNKFIKD